MPSFLVLLTAALLAQAGAVQRPSPPAGAAAGPSQQGPAASGQGEGPTRSGTLWNGEPVMTVDQADSPEPAGADAGGRPASGLPLTPPTGRQRTEGQRPAPPTAGRALVTVASSLAIVVGLFLLIVWISRRSFPQGPAPLQREVLEVLGRAPLVGRQQLHLVRIGNKLLLLSATATGAETLTEITDPLEVDRLAGLCRQSQPDSITATFRQVLAQFGSEPPAGSLLDRRSGDHLEPSHREHPAPHRHGQHETL